MDFSEMTNQNAALSSQPHRCKRTGRSSGHQLRIKILQDQSKCLRDAEAVCFPSNSFVYNNMWAVTRSSRGNAGALHYSTSSIHSNRLSPSLKVRLKRTTNT